MQFGLVLRVMHVLTLVRFGDHVPLLTDTRRHLMMEAMEFPEELQLTMDNLEVNSNPYGFGAHERGDWAADLDVKVGEPAEYIYFAGCTASFDEKNKNVARSTIQLMKEAGLDVGILRMQEGCSGILLEGLEMNIYSRCLLKQI